MLIGTDKARWRWRWGGQVGVEGGCDIADSKQLHGTVRSR